MKRFCVACKFVRRSLLDILKALFWTAVVLGVFIGIAWLVGNVSIPISMEVLDRLLTVGCFGILGLGSLALLVSWIVDNLAQAKVDCEAEERCSVPS